RVIQLPPSGRRVDLHAVMQWLGEHDINEVHVEAGARLSGALLSAGCVDELLVYMAPMLLGEGIGMVDMARLDDLALAQAFEFTETRPVAPDLRLRARHVQHWNTLLQAVGN